jgi:hypothetical protein
MQKHRIWPPKTLLLLKMSMFDSKERSSEAHFKIKKNKGFLFRHISYVSSFFQKFKLNLGTQCLIQCTLLRKTRTISSRVVTLYCIVSRFTVTVST